MATPLVTTVSYGDIIDYTPSSAVAAGDVVVQVDLVAVATQDIAADAKGALAIEGIFDFPKDVTSASAIPAGTIVYWDAGNEVATATSGSNKQIGKAVEVASNDATTVRCKLSQ